MVITRRKYLLFFAILAGLLSLTGCASTELLIFSRNNENYRASSIIIDSIENRTAYSFGPQRGKRLKDEYVRSFELRLQKRLYNQNSFTEGNALKLKCEFLLYRYQDLVVEATFYDQQGNIVGQIQLSVMTPDDNFYFMLGIEDSVVQAADEIAGYAKKYYGIKR